MRPESRAKTVVYENSNPHENKRDRNGGTCCYYRCCNKNSFRSAQSLFLNLLYSKGVVLASYLWRDHKQDKEAQTSALVIIQLQRVYSLFS